jgi:hypothetical protein
MAKSKVTAKKAEPVAVLSDKEIVLEKYPKASCINVKDKFAIFFYFEKYPLRAGIAKSEQEAWKLAAHAVL